MAGTIETQRRRNVITKDQITAGGQEAALQPAPDIRYEYCAALTARTVQSAVVRAGRWDVAPDEDPSLCHRTPIVTRAGAMSHLPTRCSTEDDDADADLLVSC